MKLTPHQRMLIRQALGLPNEHNTSYRNRVVVSKHHPDHREWMSMVAMGIAQHHQGVLPIFSLNEEGAKNALDPQERLSTSDFPGNVI